MYFNELKGQYSVEKNGARLIITLDVCFNLNEETLFLIENLPVSGEKENYLDALKALGINDAEKIFEKLVAIQVLKEKAPKPLLNSVASFLFHPNLHLIPAGFQEKLFAPVSRAGSQADKRFITGILWLALAGVAISSFFLSTYHFEYSRSGSGAHALLVVLLILAGIITHELGHSYMASYNGIGFRPIGFSIYLFYPIFYTNVSGMEHLAINEKLSVNLGGIAAQTLYMMVLLGFFFASANSVFMEAFKCLAIILLFNSNPLLKTDAYWCYQDIYEHFKSSPWARTAHVIFLTLFFGFSLFIFWKAGQLALTIVHFIIAQIRHFSFDLNWVRTLLYSYALLFLFKGGASRIKEVCGELKLTI